MSVPKKTFSLNRSSALQFFQQWGQSLFPLLYLILVLIGMLFEAYYYSYFNINIFAYSDILDFLLAPAKDIAIIVFVLLSVALSFLLWKLDQWMRTRIPKWYRMIHFGLVDTSWYRIYLKASFLFVTVAYSVLSADIYAHAHAKAIDLKPTIDVYFQNQEKNPEVLTARLIGKNKDYLFLLDDENFVRIIPTNSQVKTIRFTQKFEKPE